MVSDPFECWVFIVFLFWLSCDCAEQGVLACDVLVLYAGGSSFEACIFGEVDYGDHVDLLYFGVCCCDGMESYELEL